MIILESILAVYSAYRPLVHAYYSYLKLPLKVRTHSRVELSVIVIMLRNGPQ